MSDRREERRSARDRSRVLATGYNSSAIRLPDGLKHFVLDEPGTITLDILPYKVGKYNSVATRYGEIWWELTYWIHKRVGANEKTYIAGKTFDKTDYIAEVRQRLAKKALPPDASKEEQKEHKNRLYALLPSDMQMFFVRPESNPDNVMVWEISPFKFGGVLQDQIDAAPTSKGWEYFYDADPNGFKLEVTFKKESFSNDAGASGNFLKASRIDFIKRTDREVAKVQELHQLILEKDWRLENFLIETPYDVLRRAYEMIPDDEDDPPVSVDDHGESSSRRSEDHREPEPEPKQEERIVVREESKPEPKPETKSAPPDELTDERRAKLEELGYLGQQNGEKRTDNPFEEGTKRYKAWLAGWLRGVEESASKKAEPVKEEPKPATVESLGIKVGSSVVYKSVKCEVRRVNDDGTLNLLDANDDMHKSVPVAQVAAHGGSTETPKESPKTQPAQSKASEPPKSSNAGGVDDPEWDDWENPKS